MIFFYWRISIFTHLSPFICIHIQSNLPISELPISEISLYQNIRVAFPCKMNSPYQNANIQPPHIRMLVKAVFICVCATCNVHRRTEYFVCCYFSHTNKKLSLYIRMPPLYTRNFSISDISDIGRFDYNWQFWRIWYISSSVLCLSIRTCHDDSGTRKGLRWVVEAFCFWSSNNITE